MKLIATYLYTDVDGRTVRRKRRWLTDDNQKTFTWQHWQDDPEVGPWWSGAGGDPHEFLYGLRSIALARPHTVWTVEGEKDADSLRERGLHAVTSGEAGSWGDQHTQQLLDAGAERVIVLADHDAEGERDALKRCRSLLAAGLEVRQVHLNAKDVSEWFEQGHTEIQLSKLAAVAPPLKLEELPPANREPRRRGPREHEPLDPQLSSIYRDCLGITQERGVVHVLCPFHNDRATPSLAINLDRALWYCHGSCKTGGGPIEFLVQWRRSRKGPIEPKVVKTPFL